MFLAQVKNIFITVWQSTGIMNFTIGQVAMICISLLLLWLAIKKDFEPLLLIPIGFGGLLSNIQK